jgi:hypothetical protein
VTAITVMDVDALADQIAIRVAERLKAPAPAPVRSPALLSKSELAHALRRSSPTIDRWAKQGMPFHDMGSYRLYDLSACREWVARRPRPGRPAKVAPPTPSSTLPPGVELRTRKRGARASGAGDADAASK